MAAESVAACRAVLEVLCSHEDAEAFLEAVDWRGLGLPDYPKVIKRPMDLGKVTLRIRTARGGTCAANLLCAHAHHPCFPCISTG